MEHSLRTLIVFLLLTGHNICISAYKNVAYYITLITIESRYLLKLPDSSPLLNAEVPVTSTLQMTATGDCIAATEDNTAVDKRQRVLTDIRSK